MMTKNRKTHKVEGGVPGVPYIRHLEIHAACDRFLASRGIIDAGPAFRKSAWLYGPVTTERKSS
jgi:hypothetical protein